KPRTHLRGTQQPPQPPKPLVPVDKNVPMDLDWEELKVRPPDRAALLPPLKELEFTNLIKEYLPPETGPIVEVVETETVPAVKDGIVIDVRGDRLSIWMGNGTVHSVPLDERVMPLLSNPNIRKVTYDLKDAMVKMQRR